MEKQIIAQAKALCNQFLNKINAGHMAVTSDTRQIIVDLFDNIKQYEKQQGIILKPPPNGLYDELALQRPSSDRNIVCPDCGMEMDNASGGCKCNM